MSKQSFLKGAAVLVAASLITRVLGFVYKIVLSRMIGAEGIGLFSTVFPILGFVLTLVTAGLPTAIAKLVAEALVDEDIRRVKRIVSTGMKTVLTLSVIFTVAQVALSPWLTKHVLTDPRAYYSLLAMSPIIVIIAISSILRGYYQGLQNMTPNAVASILEQTARIITVLVFAEAMLPYGLAYAAAGAMVGMVAGEMVGLLWLVITYYRKYPLKKMVITDTSKPEEPFRTTLKAVLEIAVPVTMSRIVGSITFALEPIIVTRCLVATGVAATTATALYGRFSGMAISLLILPTVFTWSLSTTLVPAVSEAVASQDQVLVQRRLYQAFRLTALIGMPTSAILSLFAIPLSNAVFNDSGVGPILAVMAPAGFILYLQGPLTGILQGINRAGEAMRNSIIGNIVRLVVIYYLCSNPRFGIYGVAWSVVIAASLVSVLHFLSVTRHLGFYVNIPEMTKIIFATLLMSILMVRMEHQLPSLTDAWMVTLCTLGGFVIYFLVLNFMRVVTLHTIRRIPKVGPALAGFLRLVPFIR